MSTEVYQRWTLLYGAYRGVERTAATELQRGVQFYLPYVLTTRSADGADLAALQHLLLVGTADSNPAVAQLLPHIAGAVAENQLRIGTLVVDEVERFAAGAPPRYAVAEADLAVLA